MTVHTHTFDLIYDLWLSIIVAGGLGFGGGFFDAVFTVGSKVLCLLAESFEEVIKGSAIWFWFFMSVRRHVVVIMLESCWRGSMEGFKIFSLAITLHKADPTVACFSVVLG